MRAWTWKTACSAAVLLTSLGTTLAAGRIATTTTTTYASAIAGTPGPPALGFFRLTGAGAANPVTGAFTFSGTATGLGRYSAQGTIDMATLSVQGHLTTISGDTLDWTAQFAPGPLGIQATFLFQGGTGAFDGVQGGAVGPIILNQDLTFSFGLRGTLIL